DLGGFGQLVEFDVVGVRELLFDDLVAEVYALIADVHAGARNEFLDLLLALSTERALQQVAAVSDARHCSCGPTFLIAVGMSRFGGSPRVCSRRYPYVPAPCDR